MPCGYAGPFPEEGAGVVGNGKFHDGHSNLDGRRLQAATNALWYILKKNDQPRTMRNATYSES
jgi:hypothetical protein